MSLSLKDKWRNGLLKSFNSKHEMDNSLVSFLNHRDIFDVNDLKAKLPTVAKIKYDKHPEVTAMNAKKTSKK